MQFDAKSYRRHDSAEHYGTASQRHGYRGAVGYIFCGCHWDLTTELPVAKKRRKYQRSNGRELHDAGHDERGQRREV
jgi:hypothetical protein